MGNFETRHHRPFGYAAERLGKRDRSLRSARESDRPALGLLDGEERVGHWVT